MQDGSTISRLVLVNEHPRLQAMPELAKGTYGYSCFEDFTVGPLTGWPDPVAFHDARAAFWRTGPRFELPDGGEAPYLLWHQFLPHLEMQQMIAIGREDKLPLLSFDLAAKGADCIEVWTGNSLRDRLWSWYVAATLTRLGVGPQRVRMIDLGDMTRHGLDHGRMAHLLRDASEADPAPETDREAKLRFWSNACLPPDMRDPECRSDPFTAPVLDLLDSRRVDPATGLNRLRQRLLAAVRPDWTKMARTIGDAMAAGLDENDPVGDIVLQMELWNMAKLSRPLVEIDGKGAMRYCKVRLTRHGAALNTSP